MRIARFLPLPALVLSLCLAAAACGGDGAGTDSSAPDDVWRPDAADPGPDGAVDSGDDFPQPGDPGTPDEGVVPADAADDGEGPSDLPQDLQPDAPIVPPTPGDWCGRWADAWCSFRQRCGLQPPDGFAACRAAARASCWDGAFLADAVAAGDVAFDDGAGGRCLLGLMLEGCDFWWTPLTTGDGVPFPDCGWVIEGLRAAGADCRLGVECAPGAWCRVGATCPGTCKSWAARDAACGFEEPCDPAADLCRDGTCVALPGAGDACPEGICAAPLACDPADGACRAPGGPDAACGPSHAPCAAGLVCLQTDEATAGTCGLPRELDQACFEDGDCTTDAAGRLRICAGGACAAAPGPDEPCWGFRCDGAWCDTAALPPTCRALPGDGDACVQGGLCDDASWCDGGTCRPGRVAGLPCDGPWQCASRRCLGGICRLPADPPCAP
jgi:hypothetical protein